MASRTKPAARKPTRRVNAESANDAAFLPHLADLIEDGEITIGTLDPVGGVATAVDGGTCLAMLVRRKEETLLQLLKRLDLAVAPKSARWLIRNCPVTGAVAKWETPRAFSKQTQPASFP